MKKQKIYDYYKTIKEKSDYVIDKYLYIPNINYNKLEINFKENFYYLMLKIFDGEIYERHFEFTTKECNFILDYKIDNILKEVIELCSKDIVYYKKQIKKAKVKIDQ